MDLVSHSSARPSSSSSSSGVCWLLCCATGTMIRIVAARRRLVPYRYQSLGAQCSAKPVAVNDSRGGAVVGGSDPLGRGFGKAIRSTAVVRTRILAILILVGGVVACCRFGWIFVMLLRIVIPPRTRQGRLPTR